MNLRLQVSSSVTKKELTHKLLPENDLERAFLEDERFIQGLLWGKPRYGHPEGEVWRHIIEVNANIDRLNISAKDRETLRIISWVHDTFKYCEDKSVPRDWTKHHGVHARNFLAEFIDNHRLLDLVELHDEAYYIWKLTKLYDKADEGQKRLEVLKATMGDSWQLYYLFFKCDTSTGDKNLASLNWFEETMTAIKIMDFV